MNLLDLPKLNHPKLVARDWHEIEKLQALIRSDRRDAVVLHAKDNSCCNKESWNDTIEILSNAAGMPVSRGAMIEKGNTN
jgi:hypothetical protein